MYNTDLPNRADLPTSAQLKRSTILAGLSAIAILVTVVLPSEYAVDPLGVGRLLGLTEMGEIKTQLAKEAADDAAQTNAVTSNVINEDIQAITQRLGRIEMLIAAMGNMPPPVEAASSPVQNTQPAVAPSISIVPAAEARAGVEGSSSTEVTQTDPSKRSDEMSFVLTPGQGIEVKMVMNEGARVEYFWTANGAVVNFDTHGDGGGNKVSYEKGRGVGDDTGVLEAAFTGNHGWFWRNRTDADVTITLKTNGQYSEIRPMT
ncbi:hypothetical protein [Pseudochrobactrum lubricantis]|uniref:hypothetical protein n=1 Tax=Pseudochrobactrum lubricantis TaxID=558172 RepID=UPI0035DCE865